jgi:hypothetical protein
VAHDIAAATARLQQSDLIAISQTAAFLKYDAISTSQTDAYLSVNGRELLVGACEPPAPSS